ncbi:glutathionylspermidine synthase [Clostridium beijerinckii]|nr:glutathionylspermidine synthase [Clostridium beijerinckii]NOW84612.1 glutathionylspermidine synthase [Clostridium beijerinckii]
MDVNGAVGFEDASNRQYFVKAKESNWATQEQNMELEKAMEEAYKNYLESVKKANNGIY